MRSRSPKSEAQCLKEMRHLGDSESPMTTVVNHAYEAGIHLEKPPTEKLVQLESILASAMSSEPAKIGNGW